MFQMKALQNKSEPNRGSLHNISQRNLLTLYILVCLKNDAKGCNFMVTSFLNGTNIKSNSCLYPLKMNTLQTKTWPNSKRMRISSSITKIFNLPTKRT